MRNKEFLREVISQCHLHGSFKLSSGGIASEYFDLSLLILDPVALPVLVQEISMLLGRCDSVGCLESCPTPLVGALVYEIGLPGFVVRKQTKVHGTQKLIEGHPGNWVTLVEDVTATGQSVMKAIKAVENSGSQVISVIAIVNRHEGCDELLARYDFRWLFEKKDFIM